jgi:hypothetical protein
MAQIARELFQAWTRSFEEDEGDVHVYRPASYRFPRQRGPRDGIEFRADGSLVLLTPGPADKRERVEGRWYVEGCGRLRVSGIGGVGERTLEILHVDAGLLKIRGIP